jgi:hypothetical protein
LKCNKKDKVQKITVSILRNELVEKNKNVIKDLEVSSQLQDKDDLFNRTVSDDEFSYESYGDDYGNNDDDLAFKD